MMQLVVRPRHDARLCSNRLARALVPLGPLAGDDLHLQEGKNGFEFQCHYNSLDSAQDQETILYRKYSTACPILHYRLFATNEY